MNRLDRMYRHNSKAAFIDPSFFFNLGFNCSCIILFYIYEFFLFFNFRLVVGILVLVLQ